MGKRRKHTFRELKEKETPVENNCFLKLFLLLSSEKLVFRFYLFNRRVAMSSFVDVKNVEPTYFEEQHYDEYEYYNLSEKYTCGASRKGRSKKESSDNTNRPNPGGHERKLVEKLQNTEKKAKE